MNILFCINDYDEYLLRQFIMQNITLYNFTPLLAMDLLGTVILLTPVTCRDVNALGNALGTGKSFLWLAHYLISII